VARLLDPDTGFNYWIQQAAPDYNLPSFQLQQSVNLFQGALTANLIEEAGDCTYPLCIVSSAKATNQNIVTPNEFGGVVNSIVDFYVSFADTRPPLNSDPAAEMIEDAMYETFNRSDYYGISTDPALTYNNQMDVTYFPVQFGGLSWIKLVRFNFTHRYFTMGR
jgi:hypothetical protein